VFEVVIWLVPAAVLVAGVRSPRGGLAVFVASLPLFGSPPGGPYLAALDVAALAAVVTAWHAGRPKRSPLDVAALAFVVIGLASLLPIAWHPPSWNPNVLLGLVLEFPYVERWSILYTWRAAANLVLGWLLFCAVRRSFERRQLIELGWALALGEAMVLILGLAEFTGMMRLSAYRVIGLDNYDARLHSLFFHSGWFAEFLVIASPIALVSLWRIPRWGGWAAGALISLAIPSVLFTQQRGAWFCLVLELAIGGFFFARQRGMRPRTRHRAMMYGLLLLILVVAGIVLISMANAAAFKALVERSTRVVSDLSNRTKIWRLTWNVAVERPVLGWGIGSFSPVYDLVATKGVRHRSIWLTAHNQYLMLFVERGLLAVASFLLLGGTALVALLQRVRSRDAGSETNLTLGLVLSAGAVGLYGFVQYLFFLRVIEWMIWLLLGMIAVLASGTRYRWTDRIAWGLMVVSLVAGLTRIGRQPAPSRGDRAYGLHAPEFRHDHSQRWTAPHAALRVHRRPGDLRLEVANGHPAAARYPLSVTIRIDGSPLRTVHLTDGDWHRIWLPSKDLPERDFVLGLDAGPGFRPFVDAARDDALRPSRDIRRLGVALRPLEWRERENSTPPG
jgi:O-antigen ligase